MSKALATVSLERIERAIVLVRGEKVILDSDLAALYGVTTKRLNEQVKRNKGRFPDDFILILTEVEKAEVVANCDFKKLKFSPNRPYAFTEHGASMAPMFLTAKELKWRSQTVTSRSDRMTKMSAALVRVPAERIQQAIYRIRGQNVMLDRDLASLYGVPTKALKQAVRRNLERFPDDFMFVLDTAEFQIWRSQFVTSKGDRKGLRYPPMAFTEQGVAMLSSVLKSRRAVHVNIAIMRTFVHLRQMLASNAELARKLEELEKKYDAQFKVVFDAIRALMTPPEPKRKRIGFQTRTEHD